MIEIGKKQKLIVAKTVDFGVYLAEDKNAGQEEHCKPHSSVSAPSATIV